MKRKGKGKQKGNQFENLIAKKLSRWIFWGDQHVLGRHPTSGAKKVAYVGDIIPQKSLYDYNWLNFPLHFELKTGYPQHEATFNNQTQIRKWIIKGESELTIDQSILWLIVRFKNKQPVLITNRMLSNVYWNLALNIEDRGLITTYYIYNLYSLMKLNFYDIVLYPEMQYNTISD
jgi:hypothetical protein